MNIIFRDLLLLNLIESSVLEIVLPALIDMLDRLCRYLACDQGCSSRALEQPGRKKGHEANQNTYALRMPCQT
jgi:hypothetical protein